MSAVKVGVYKTDRDGMKKIVQVDTLCVEYGFLPVFEGLFTVLFGNHADS